MYISKEKAGELLDNYDRLTAPGKDLNTLEKLSPREIAEAGIEDDEIYKWMGRFDQGPTYHNRESALKLIPGVNWKINLF